MMTDVGITADRLSECLMGAEMLFHCSIARIDLHFQTDPTLKQGGTSCKNIRIKISTSGIFYSVWRL